MSASVEWSLLCDVDGCDRKIVARSNVDDTCIAKVRDIGMLAGWHVGRVEGEMDLCPDHRPRRKAPR